MSLRARSLLSCWVSSAEAMEINPVNRIAMRVKNGFAVMNDVILDMVFSTVGVFGFGRNGCSTYQCNRRKKVTQNNIFSCFDSAER